MRKSLTREERLRGGSDIYHVLKNPERMFRCREARLLACHNNLEINRFAAIPIKKMGSAVKRNYTKRILKEIYRELKCEMNVGYDIIVISYSGGYNYTERKKHFIELIRKADIAK
ncbi:ribonuclease P protein component [Olavius algarvensis spirochete endosymbiont]|uniref:ribonuclease P protein component n=1 Tax=Olavius algarvensis spirochete endosymbiont TaxID=260710 RepID=UPI00068F02FA|nr:ribonuclease P protein component [Olavius algarvensis spirochete endosymbiont]